MKGLQVKSICIQQAGVLFEDMGKTEQNMH